MTQRIRHNKRGSTYTVIGDAEAQISIGDGLSPNLRILREGMKLRVYQGEDGKLWARFPDEFEERFTPVEGGA